MHMEFSNRIKILNLISLPFLNILENPEESREASSRPSICLDFKLICLDFKLSLSDLSDVQSHWAILS